MADERELFRTIKDSAGDGEAVDLRQQGDAVSSANSHMVLGAEDASNNLDLLQVQAEGSAVPTKGQANLTVKDESGNLQYIPMLDGRISVTSDIPGTIFEDNQTTTATKGTDVDSASLTLTASRVYDEVEIIVSSFKPVLWKLVQIDDATTTTLFSVVTGSGSFDFSKLFKNKQVTAGASGTQTLKITGNQLTGSGSDSDMHTYISCIEKPL